MAGREEGRPSVFCIPPPQQRLPPQLSAGQSQRDKQNLNENLTKPLLSARQSQRDKLNLNENLTKSLLSAKQSQRDKLNINEVLNKTPAERMTISKRQTKSK